MIVDTHIHIAENQEPNPQMLLKGMDEQGIDKLVLFSKEPAYYEKSFEKRKQINEQRLKNLMTWCDNSGGRLQPVYFVNPIEEDAIQQCKRAVEQGVIGFKIICETFYPGDERAMPVYQYISDCRKSILFHSGILWDYGNNADFNRPGNWECMFDIKGIRFALAHIAWPWHDELIAVYGKFMALSDHPRYGGQQMFIDMTPGTPPCYRKEVICRLFDVEYDEMEKRLLFGSDSFTDSFDAKNIRALLDSDDKIFQSMGLSQSVQRDIFGQNALSFWGI